MRINQFLARHTELSRRSADKEIEAGNVTVNGRPAEFNTHIKLTDKVVWKGREVRISRTLQTILLNKPTGYVCSRKGQGSKTIYDLLPANLGHLNPAGRLDKDSSGLLVMTNDGDLALKLTHPRFQKLKKYTVTIDKPLQPLHHQMINDIGINLEDGKSKLILEKLDDNGTQFMVTMYEGRNRQIRRTFAAVGYDVRALHRIQFGEFQLGELAPGSWKVMSAPVDTLQ